MATIVSKPHTLPFVNTFLIWSLYSQARCLFLSYHFFVTTFFNCSHTIRYFYNLTVVISVTFYSYYILAYHSGRIQMNFISLTLYFYSHSHFHILIQPSFIVILLMVHSVRFTVPSLWDRNWFYLVWLCAFNINFNWNNLYTQYFLLLVLLNFTILVD
jgi:hypothetical protein